MPDRQNRPSGDPTRSWITVLALVLIAFLIGAYLDNQESLDDEVVVIDPQISASSAELEAALQVRTEIARIARDAHKQGMTEALDAVKGTPDGQALERSCAALWRQQQPQQ